jgi:hypothetical protein
MTINQVQAGSKKIRHDRNNDKLTYRVKNVCVNSISCQKRVRQIAIT